MNYEQLVTFGVVMAVFLLVDGMMMMMLFPQVVVNLDGMVQVLKVVAASFYLWNAIKEGVK